MSHLNIVRAWKDEDYRASLSDADRALLPDNPAGSLEGLDGFAREMMVAGAGSFECTCLSECVSINLACGMTGLLECSINFICMLPDTTPLQPILPLMPIQR